MKIQTAMLALASAVVALAFTGALQAHHSVSMFDIATPIWLKATFAGFDRVNPHSIINLEESTADGGTRRWSIEGPAAFQLDQRGVTSDFMRPGEVMEVCGFALKEEFLKARSPRTGEGYPPEFLHGHLLVLPGGEMRAWGSYGKMENCIRPGDRVETWVEFVNSDARARSLWCSSRNFAAIPSIAPPALVAGINREMDAPCD